MNQFVIKDKLKRIRKSGTYSRFLQRYKRRILPSSDVPQEQNTESSITFPDVSNETSFKNEEISFELLDEISKIGMSGGIIQFHRCILL